MYFWEQGAGHDSTLHIFLFSSRSTVIIQEGECLVWKAACVFRPRIVLLVVLCRYTSREVTLSLSSEGTLTSNVHPAWSQMKAAQQSGSIDSG